MDVDLLSLIISVNKVSILAFVVILGFLIYEIYQMRGEKKYASKLDVPQFNPNAAVQTLGGSNTIVQQTGTKKTVSHKLLIMLLTIMSLFFGGLSLWGVINSSQVTTSSNSQAQIIIQEVRSPGVKIYNKEWKELTQTEVSQLKPGDAVIIGVVTIPEADIDKARIRVNTGIWDTNHIATQFNNSYNLFYREYMIGSEEGRLKIEAQLHSQKDGWLGE